MKLYQKVRDLSSPDQNSRTAAEHILQEYFSQHDLDVADRNQRYLLRKLRAMDNVAARRLLHFYDELKRKPLGVEEELRSYLKTSRIEEKEFYEAKYFFQKVSPLVANVHTIVDCCSGNGLAGLVWGLEGEARTVILVDKEKNSDFPPLMSWVNSQMDLSVQYHVLNLEQENIPEGDMLSAVHACGSLTDRIIQEGLRRRIPFAVMPCCYKDSMHLPEGSLSYFQNKRDAIDAARIMAIQEQGYQVIIRSIDPTVTPMNRIIIGLPAERMTVGSE